MKYGPLAVAAVIALAAMYLSRRYTRRRMDPDRRPMRKAIQLLVLVGAFATLMLLGQFVSERWALAIPLLTLGLWNVIADTLIFGVDVRTGPPRRARPLS